ncbi:Unknown protein [Striga hermonthica]|uniref:Uncharacterized protein n=1 Tax=Striga hermonthica TaxID=68872 RepID=A0A9N7NBA8_STRHE|nr:Unknown protein [Striga hermonthica]
MLADKIGGRTTTRKSTNNGDEAIKLVKKLPPHSTQAAPFLTLEARGHKSAVIQDVPVSKPLSRTEVLELQIALEASQEMPATLVRAPDLNSLQSFVDRMKHVGDVMGVTVTKYGDLHLQISTSLITLGAEFRKLMVLGERESRAGTRQTDKSISLHCRLPVLDPGSN